LNEVDTVSTAGRNPSEIWRVLAHKHQEKRKANPRREKAAPE
jgi:hypothetical protein